ncbi:hypothetical protein RF55_26248, partial [Lasius niger]
GLAAASTATETHIRPYYPGTSHSKGFRLAINVTDHSNVLYSLIQNKYIGSIHVGAGLALVGWAPDTEYARIFYQNGTAEEHRSGMDKKSPAVSTAHLDAGPGTPGIYIAPVPEPYAFLFPDTWTACNESISYYPGKHFVIFKRVETNHNIPDGCVPVRLIPECIPLNDLPPESLSSHEYAIDDRCYKDVTAL